MSLPLPLPLPLSNSSTPRRTTPRSASTTSLFPHPRTTAHIRRPSRHLLPPNNNNRSSLPSLPSPPSLPSAIHRLVISVDYLVAYITRRATPNPPILLHLDPYVALFLLLSFLVLFTILFNLFASFLAPNPLQSYHQHVAHNNRLIASNLPPLQFWPLPDSLQHSLNSHNHPSALVSDVTASHIHHYRTHSLFSTVPAPAIALVAACQDRTAFLQTALPTWQAALSPTDEIILVDWHSVPPDTVPLPEVVRALRDDRISVVSVYHQPHWVLSMAYNLAFTLVRAKWVFKVDCDTMLQPDFLQAHPLPIVGKYYRFQWNHATNPNQQHLNGVFLAQIQAVRNVNGYDERIATYGWDDDDLYARLEKHGNTDDIPLIPLAINETKLHHIFHSDHLRASNQRLTVSPTLETQINQQASSHLTSWTLVGSAQKATYRLNIHSKKAHFLSATLLQSPAPLLSHLSPDNKRLVIEQATNQLLHDTYFFPYNVLTEINSSRQHLLTHLTKLQSSTKWRCTNGVIFAHVAGTIPQRVLAILSSLALAIETDRPLFLACSNPREAAAAAAAAVIEPPRVTHFFDIEATNALVPNAAHIFQVAKWKCQSTVSVCAASDAAFLQMMDFRTGVNEEQTSNQVLDTLKGAEGMRNVLLRLEASFPLHWDVLRKAVQVLQPSAPMHQMLALLPDLHAYMGVYVAHSVTKRAAEAMVQRLQEHAADGRFFVAGANRDITQYVRVLLGRASAGVDSSLPLSQINEDLRQIAEVFALARCQTMVNDGRPPKSLIKLVQLLKSKVV